MENKTHTAFPAISSQTQTYNHNIAVLFTVNKLKKTQEKILQAKKKQAVQKRIDESFRAKQFEKRKNQLFKKIVRNSVEIDKSIKFQFNMKKEIQIEKLHSFNCNFRQTKFKFRQTIKSMQKQQNHQIYHNAKSQRKKNQQFLKQFKKRQLELKKSHRKRMAQQQQQSKEKVEMFRHSRIMFIQKERQKDVQELQKKIIAKARYLQKLHQSQNNFQKTKTKFKYRSNSSFHSSDQKKSGLNLNHEIQDENLNLEDQKTKVGSITNPENQPNEQIFSLTESKKEAIAEECLKQNKPSFASEKPTINDKNFLNEVQKFSQAQIIKDTVEQESKDNPQKKIQILQNINEPFKPPKELIQSEPLTNKYEQFKNKDSSQLK